MPKTPTLASFRRIVVKVGSSLLVDSAAGSLKRDWLASLAADIAALHKDKRDGARGHHDDVAFLFMEGGDIGGERGQPVALERAGGGVHQQRRADLHDDAAEVFERGRFGHGTRRRRS